MKKIIAILIISISLIKILIVNAYDYSLNISGIDYKINYTSYNDNSVFLIKNDLLLLNNILTSDTIKINSKNIIGDSLINYDLSNKTDYYKINGVGILDLFNKYGINIEGFLNQQIYTPQDCFNKAQNIIKSIFRGLNNDDNFNTINGLSQYFGNKLYLYKIRLENYTLTDSPISSDILNNLGKIIQLGFENKKNILSKGIENKIGLLENEYSYISGLANQNNKDSLDLQYNISIQKLNINYNELLNLINQKYTSDEILNISTLSNKDINILGIINEAKNNSKTGIPYIFNETTRINLINTINSKKSYILNKIDSKYSFLLNILNGTGTVENNTDSLSLSGTNYIIGSNKIINNNNDTIDLLIESYSGYVFKDESSSDIFNIIKNGSQTTNYDIIGLNLIKNIETFTTNSGIIIQTLSDIGNVIRFDSILENDTKNTFSSLQDSIDTIKTISLNDFDINSSSDQLGNIYLKNFGKKLLNKINTEQNDNLPIGIKINNETILKNDIQSLNTNYLVNYDKSLYTHIDSVVNEEGFELLSFGYTPSPKIIKDSNGNNIGIDYGNLIMYYLNNTYMDFIVDLVKGFNYRISIDSFNGDTNNLSLKYNYNGNITNILLSGENSLENENGIISSIDNIKYINNQKNVLFVNDVIKK